MQNIFYLHTILLKNNLKKLEFLVKAMTKTEEGKLEEQVNNYLKKRRVWKLARFQAQSNQNGVPDRLYLYKGILLGFELKTKTGKPKGLQIKKIAAINDKGGIDIIVTDAP